MNIQPYTTKTGKKGYVLKGAYIGIDILTGEQVRTTIRGRTKTEVQLKLKNKIKDFENNGHTFKKEASIKTCDELIDAWLIYYEKTVKAGTLYTTQSNLNKYIRPLIGKYRLDKITPTLMQNKINEFISKEAQKRNDYKTILSLIKRIFKYAVSLDLINDNPMDKTIIHTIKKEAAKDEEIKFYDKDELNQLLLKLDNLTFKDWKSVIIKTYLYLLIFSGMRSGEALALEWSDFNFNEKTVSINKTLNRFDKLEKTPKTKSSIRTIELDSETLKIMNQYKKTQIEKSWELGITPPKFVFWNLLQEKYYSYTYVRKAYYDICSEIDIPIIGLHGIRHTHATMYVNAGIDFKTLQERLGHEKLSMTMDTYAHVLKETKQDSLNSVINFISNA